MSLFLKSLCSLLPKSKVVQICDNMDCVHWERELLLEYLCEPRISIESMIHNNKHNYKKRMQELENRVFNYLLDDIEMVDRKVILSLYFQQSKINVDKKDK